jgi:hypothetical protein
MNKEEQKKLLTEIMDADAKDGLYHIGDTNKMVTAVEWLAERYNYITWMRNRDEISACTADEWREKFLQEAKAMEKEQIIDAYAIGRDRAMAREQAVDYYNETYLYD